RERPVALADQNAQLTWAVVVHEIAGGDGEVGFAVAVEIGADERVRSLRSNGIADGGAKGAIAAVDEHAHTGGRRLIVANIRYGHVRLAVAVEVSNSDGVQK